jgi:hypothetical protein
LTQKDEGSLRSKASGDGVSWENQFDHSVRTVRLELSGAPRMERYGFGWRDEKLLFQPQFVELLFDNDVRRSVSVRGARVLKNGDLGLRQAESYYSFTKDDTHMPEWLKRLVAEVSS